MKSCCLICDEGIRFFRVLRVEQCTLELQGETCGYGDMVGRARHARPRSWGDLFVRR